MPNTCARCGRWRDSRHEIVRKVKEAIAPLDAAGDALADNGAGAAERGDGGLAPRRVVRMDDRGRGARGYLFDEGLKKPAEAGKGCGVPFRDAPAVVALLYNHLASSWRDSYSSSGAWLSQHRSPMLNGSQAQGETDRVGNGRAPH
jgi:hypothetical protein